MNKEFIPYEQGLDLKELLQLWKEQQLKTIWYIEFDSQGKLKLKK